MKDLIKRIQLRDVVVSTMLFLMTFTIILWCLDIGNTEASKYVVLAIFSSLSTFITNKKNSKG
jgi:hypothetical protein